MLRRAVSPGFRVRHFVASRNDSGGFCTRLRQQPQPQILRHVGVLVLVDQDVFETLLVLAKNFRRCAEQADILQQKIAEVGGVERLQPLLIGDVKLLALAVGEARRFARRHLFRRQAAVLPAVEDHGENARRPAFLVELLGFQDLFDDADLVVDVQNREIRLQTDHFRVAPQDFHADRMESAQPRHALDDLPDHLADAQLHLARRLVGEGDRQDVAGPGAAEIEDVGDPRRQNAGFPRPRAGQHQHRAVERLDCFPLLRVQIGQIGRAARAEGARRYPAGNGRGVQLDAAIGLSHVILSARRWHSRMAISRGEGPLVALVPPL